MKLPSIHEITKTPLRPMVTVIHLMAMGKHGLDIFGRVEFNGANDEAPRMVTAP